MSRAWLLLLALLQDPSTAKIELKFRPVEGDKIEISDSWTHAFRGKLGDEPLLTSTRGGGRNIVEMARVENGVLSRKVVKVADSYIETQDPQTSKYIRKDQPLNGRTVTVERKGGREVYGALQGVSEADLKAISIDDPLTRLYPDKPVAVGDTWEISGEGLKKFFPAGDFTKGQIVVTLRDIKEIDGRRCALLVTNYDVSGQAADGVTRELRLQGTLTVWIDRGYILAMSQSGRLKTSGADPKTSQPNGEAAVTGELKAAPVEKTK